MNRQSADLLDRTSVRLSAISYQLSAISYQLSAISYQSVAANTAIGSTIGVSVPHFADRAGVGGGEAKVTVREQRGNASARRALQISLLDQIGFKHVLNGVALFANSRRQIVDPDRTTIEFVQDGFQQFPVHQVKANRINVEHFQRGVGHFGCDVAVRSHLGVDRKSVV